MPRHGSTRNYSAAKKCISALKSTGNFNNSEIAVVLERLGVTEQAVTTSLRMTELRRELNSLNYEFMNGMR
jgi:hypothetical protein